MAKSDTSWPIVNLLKADHPLRKEIEEALIENNLLPQSIGIARDAPGDFSRPSDSSRQREAFELLKQSIDYIDET